VLLPKAQQAAHQHDHQDDHAIGERIERKRKNGRPDQDQDDGAGELAQQQLAGAGLGTARQPVGALLPQALGRLLLTEARLR